MAKLRKVKFGLLCYTGAAKRVSTAKIRRQYMAWRAAQSPPLPERCDNAGCQFFTAPLIWDGKPIKPILDHKDGVNTDNRPKALRLLCPNCDSQLPTRGGGNKGRVEKSSGGYAIVRRDGSGRDYVMPVGQPLSDLLFGEQTCSVCGKVESTMVETEDGLQCLVCATSKGGAWSP